MAAILVPFRVSHMFTGVRALENRPAASDWRSQQAAYHRQGRTPEAVLWLERIECESEIEGVGSFQAKLVYGLW